MTGKERTRVVAPEKAGARYNDVAVDQPRGMEVVGDRGPALDEQLEHAPAAELAQDTAEVARELECRLHPGVARHRAEHDTQRLGPLDAVIEADGQLGIIGPHGAGAHEHGVRAGPQPVHVAPGLLSGDPAARPVGRSGARVQAGRHLEHHPRPPVVRCLR